MMSDSILDITDVSIADEDICCSFIEYLFSEDFSEVYIEETSIDWDDLYFTVKNNKQAMCEVGLYDDNVCVFFHNQNIYYQHPDIDNSTIIEQFINISEEF